jgi:hypothetical protein
MLAQLPESYELWAGYLRFWIAPAVGVAALVMPMLALAAVLTRRLVRPAFVLLVLFAVIGFAYYGVERSWQAQQATGVAPEVLDGLETVPLGAPN